MKNILNIIGIVVLTASLCGCSQYLTDTPSVTFDEQSYMMTAAGGQIVIPVQSTGVDDVNIHFSDKSNWEVDENGDMTPKEGWIKIVKVIDNYQTTRDLAEWTSGIVLSIEPNEKTTQRTAYVTVTSFNVSNQVKITQSGLIVD